MKKVLYVATVDIHIKTFHLPYLKMLHDMGYEVHVATNGTEQFPYCDKKYTIPIERSPYKLKNIKAIKELKKIINKENYDIVHCHTPMGSVVTRLAAKNARKNGTRVIYTAHGFHFYKGAPIINWLLFYPIEKYLAKYTDTLITINKEDYNLAKSRFFKRCKDIEYLPGIGVDSSKFDLNISDRDKKTLMNELKLKNDDFVIIYPARLCPDKNQILLLKLMQRLNNNSNIKLLLPGKDEYNGFYQKFVNNNKINNVLFLGHRNDISKLLKISDLLIATSIREGFGINLVEALASETPVIAVDNRGHREIIVEGENGFIIKNDINDLMDKFNLIYNNHDLYNKLKANSYKSVRKYFLNNSIKEMKKIYDI